MAKLGIPTEHQEQVMVCKWLDLRGVAFFSVANGGLRHIATARRLKAEGVKAGVPDLIILTPPRKLGEVAHVGTVVEMKRAKSGRLSQPQGQWLTEFARYGWATVVGYGADDAIKQLSELGY